MTDPYIASDILDQAAEAIRQNVPLTTLASRLRCSPDHLARLLGLPVNPASSEVLDDPDYLWAVDKLNEVL